MIGYVRRPTPSTDKGSSSITDNTITINGISILRNPYIEEEQTTQWPKEKVQKDKLSTKHTHKTEDRVTRTQLRTGAELRCSGRVGSSCSSSGACLVTLVTNPVVVCSSSIYGFRLPLWYLQTLFTFSSPEFDFSTKSYTIAFDLLL
jgi:hypothetical protein